MIDADDGKQYTYSSEADDLLLDRARDIADDVDTLEAAQRSYLCFDVGGSTYAVESGSIRHVLSGRTIVPVPFTPDFVRGIAHHDGIFLTVVDVPALVGAASPSTTVSHLLVLTDDSSLVCIATESVPFTVSVTSGDVRPVRDSAPGWIAELLDGVLTHTGTPIGILSPRHIVSHRRLRALLEPHDASEAS